MNNHKEKWAILGIIILALWMRLHFMSRSFFYDELYTAVHGMQAPNIIDALYKDYSETNHLGYTFIAYLTCHMLGIKEWTVRLPALIFGLGSILLFWQWSQRSFGIATAILGSLLLAMAPAHIIWSASGRGYSACIFFTILSTRLYFSLLEKPSLKTALWLTLVNTFAFSFQIYALFVFIAQILHYCWDQFRNKAWSYYFPLSVVVTILGSLIIYFPALAKITSLARGHREFVPDFPVTLLKDLLSLPLWPLGILCLILMLIGFIRTNVKLPHWRLYVSILFLMIFPLWLSKPIYIYPRFFAYLLPFMFLLLTEGIISIIEFTPLRARAWMIAAAVLVAGAVFWTWIFKPSKIVDDFHYKFRESVEFAESIATPQTSFCAFGNEGDFFQYYSHRPVTTFKDPKDFITFITQKDKIICFSMIGLPMSEEQRQIALFIFAIIKPKAVNFDNIIVFDLKE